MRGKEVQELAGLDVGVAFCLGEVSEECWEEKGLANCDDETFTCLRK